MSNAPFIKKIETKEEMMLAIIEKDKIVDSFGYSIPLESLKPVGFESTQEKPNLICKWNDYGDPNKSMDYTVYSYPLYRFQIPNN